MSVETVDLINESPVWCDGCGRHHRSDARRIGRQPTLRRRLSDVVTWVPRRLAWGLLAVAGRVEGFADAPARADYEAAREAWNRRYDAARERERHAGGGGS
jgi:cobalamin biosynthesis protein CobD/CbiB